MISRRRGGRDGRRSLGLGAAGSTGFGAGSRVCPARGRAPEAWLRGRGAGAGAGGSVSGAGAGVVAGAEAGAGVGSGRRRAAAVVGPEARARRRRSVGAGGRGGWGGGRRRRRGAGGRRRRVAGAGGGGRSASEAGSQARARAARAPVSRARAQASQAQARESQAREPEWRAPGWRARARGRWRRRQAWRAGAGSRVRASRRACGAGVAAALRRGRRRAGAGVAAGFGVAGASGVIGLSVVGGTAAGNGGKVTLFAPNGADGRIGAVGSAFGSTAGDGQRGLDFHGRGAGLLRLQLDQRELHRVGDRDMRHALRLVDPAGRLELLGVLLLQLERARLLRASSRLVGEVGDRRVGANPIDDDQGEDDEHDQPTQEGEDAGRRTGGVFARHVSSSE